MFYKKIDDFIKYKIVNHRDEFKTKYSYIIIKYKDQFGKTKKIKEELFLTVNFYHKFVTCEEFHDIAFYGVNIRQREKMLKIINTYSLKAIILNRIKFEEKNKLQLEW